MEKPEPWKQMGLKSRPLMRWWLDSVVFGGFFRRLFHWHLPRMKEKCKDWPTFTRSVREFEHWVFIKLTMPRGRYVVREISRGQFEVIKVNIEFLPPAD